MTDRVNGYYGHPASPEFVHHMIHEIGLSARDQQLVIDLRENYGDTEFFANLAGMDTKKYSQVIGRVHMREMAELLRLAQIGYDCLHPEPDYE